jgi:hypothetical protein
VSGAGEICVAHLVRRSNEISAFKAFLDSYKRCPAGVPHELLLIFKGFSRPADFGAFDELLACIPHQRATVTDSGFDVGPYLKVAREHRYRYFAFLNSFSRILVPGWLEHMYREIRRPGAGLVGATGSHQSIASDFHLFRWETRRSSPAYKRLLGPWLRYVRYLVTIRGRFPPYPNYHVRTNAFMIEREVMVNLRCAPIVRKWDAYRFESGSTSLTCQVTAAGLSAAVVGTDGRAYPPQEWAGARTFWISDQENLLASDNQTRAYAEGGAPMRERLAFHAWRRWPNGAPRQDPPPLPE